MQEVKIGNVTYVWNYTRKPGTTYGNIKISVSYFPILILLDAEI